MKKYTFILGALLLFSGLSAQQQTTFNYTGGSQTFIVPPCVYTVSVDITGAQGGDHTGTSGTSFGGKGGRVTGTIAVKPGDILYIYVGGKGGFPAGNMGGFNGGGNGGDVQYCAGGGGATDIRLNGTDFTDRIFVAGGGGGAGTNCWGNGDHGGQGGGLIGGNGTQCNQMQGGAPNYPGAGGTQNAGGITGNDQGQGCVTPGKLGYGGNGACTYGGGGGGGYYGGGGSGYGGAGGGSSYNDPKAKQVKHVQGFQAGNGYVILKYENSPVQFTVQDTISVDAGPLTLLPVKGGVFSGYGVKNGKFYPDIAGVGTHTIYFTYSNPGDPCTGTSSQKILVLSSSRIKEQHLSQLNIYPNPANDMINIYVPTGISDMSVEIMNADGAVLYTKEGVTITKGGIMRIDVSTFSAGIYFVRLTSELEVFTKKVAIQR